MEREIEPEIMNDVNGCLEYNNVSNRQFQNGSFLQDYKTYCNFNSGKLLDLGTGPGHHLKILKDNYPNLDITGTDMSYPMCTIARANTNLAIIQMDFNKLECEVDCIVCLNTLHHQHDPIKFWNTIKRLNPKYLYIEDLERPKQENFDKLIKHDDSIDDFKHSLRASFTVDEVKKQLNEVELHYDIVVKEIEYGINRFIVYQKT